METIIRMFELTLRSSLEAAFMVGILVLITAALRRQLPPLWRYALWALLLVKLLLPWMPGSLGDEFSWIRLPERMVPHAGIAMQEPFDSAAPPAGQASTWMASEGWNERVAPSAPASDAGRSAFPVMEIAAVIWLIGALAGGMAILVAGIRFALAIRREGSTPVPGELQALFARICAHSGIRVNSGIRPTVRLQLSSLVTTPTLFGLLSPIVLIPRKMADQLDADEWECVLRHELVHYRRKDIAVNTLFTLLAAVHWFNPAVWYGLRRLRFEQEAACDASVLAALGDRAAYPRSIIKVLEIGASGSAAPAGIGFSNYKSHIKRRMSMIRNYEPSKRRAGLLGVAVLCVVALFALPSVYAKEGLEADRSAAKPGPAAAVLPGGEPEEAAVTAGSATGAMEETVKLSTGDVEAVTFVMPASGSMTAGFGYRTHPNTKQQSLHDGIDIADREGTDVTAAASGNVVSAEYDGTYGYTVVIEHDARWHTEYRHLQSLSVEQGEAVNAGDRVGGMGSTGAATGSHLHFSVRLNGEYVDPEPLLHERTP